MDSFMVRAKDFVPIGYLFKSGKKTALLNTGLKRRFFFFALEDLLMPKIFLLPLSQSSHDTEFSDSLVKIFS